MITDKKTLRRQLLNHRDSFENRDYADRIISNHLLDFSKDYRRIFTYINYSSEVNTEEFIRKSLQYSKEIYAPICNINNYTMIASRVENFDSLTKNAYGILEPKFSDASNVMFDAIIVPGAAFDIKGNRIGYGKGYYDKFIDALEYNVVKIGLCYDFQLLDNIPTEEHDAKMDIIITESRMVIL